MPRRPGARPCTGGGAAPSQHPTAATKSVSLIVRVVASAAVSVVGASGATVSTSAAVLTSWVARCLHLYWTARGHARDLPLALLLGNC